MDSCKQRQVDSNLLNYRLIPEEQKKLIISDHYVRQRPADIENVSKYGVQRLWVWRAD